MSNDENYDGPQCDEWGRSLVPTQETPAMKTIKQEIRERLAAEQLSPANVDACFEHIQSDPLMRSMSKGWGNALWVYTPQFVESVWVSAWSSARDWMLAQITAPVTKEGSELK